MVKLNRRSLLHLIGAASLAPALPSIAAPARAATPAQMLWASMHARAGSQAKFASVAGSFGVSPTAARGIGAKALGARALAYQGARHLARGTATASPMPSLRRRLARLDLERVLNRIEAGDKPQDNAHTKDTIPPQTDPKADT